MEICNTNIEIDLKRRKLRPRPPPTIAIETMRKIIKSPQCQICFESLGTIEKLMCHFELKHQMRLDVELPLSKRVFKSQNPKPIITQEPTIKLKEQESIILLSGIETWNVPIKIEKIEETVSYSLEFVDQIDIIEQDINQSSIQLNFNESNRKMSKYPEDLMDNQFPPKLPEQEQRQGNYTKCKFCEANFHLGRNPNGYLNHLKPYKDNKLNSCPSCLFPFQCRNGLQSHLKDETNLLSIHNCTFCDLTFANRNCLLHHQIIHKNKTKNPLPEPEEMPVLLSSIKSEGSSKVPCNFCGCPYASYSLADHVKRVHNNEGKARPFICTFCKSTFTADRYLIRHCRKYHKNLDETMPALEQEEIESYRQLRKRKSPEKVEAQDKVIEKEKPVVVKNRKRKSNKVLAKKIEFEVNLNQKVDANSQNLSALKSNQVLAKPKNVEYEIDLKPNKDQKVDYNNSLKWKKLKSQQETVCDYCSKTISNLANLKRHIGALHPKQLQNYLVKKGDTMVKHSKEF